MWKITGRAGIILAFLLVWFGAFPAARAVNPNWPNNPDEDPRLEQPDDPGFGDRWPLLSYIPDVSLPTIRPAEILLGSGVSADRAYQVTTGSPNVIVAVLDSGIRWDVYDLVNKFYLNTGELPLPEGAQEYDANGDGIFNIRDYDGDSRVYDADGNGWIDPHDLILIFSDGVDGDENGYIDDISGWDFFKHDNDPTDDPGFWHGTWEAEGIAAEANNGSGDIGVCPDCMILPVRVSDTFVGDGNHFAQAVVFAVDSGAQVISEALGVLNNPNFARDAVAYALSNGVSISASAADENGFHHNYPASYPGTIHTNNVIHDNKDLAQTTSFMALDACTNWGPKITVSAASWGCSSGATAIMGGALGMVYSRADDIDLSPPLSALEVFGIITTSATDIYVPEAAENPFIYPSRPGWDKYFGFGRLNVRTAVDLVSPQTIPPEAIIQSPDWFAIVDDRQLAVPIRGYINARRASSYDFRLEAVASLEPEEGDWIILAQRQHLTRPTNGVLGYLRPDLFPPAKAIKHDVTDQHAILARLVVTDVLGNEVKYYHSFFLYHDDDWTAGSPKYLGASGEASAKLGDVDGDGIEELIFPTADGQVHALKGDGAEAPGWPATAYPVTGQDPEQANYLGSRAYQSGALDGERHQSILSASAVADLDGDGELEVVADSFDGYVYVWESNGELREGFPVTLDPDNSANPYARQEFGIFGSPVLADLDGDPDGELEILAAGMDQWVYAWHADGTPVFGWPVLCRDVGGQQTRIVSTPALGDINGDGEFEVLVSTDEYYDNTGRIYAVYRDGYDHPSGPFLPNWPVAVPSFEAYYLPYVGEGASSTPVLADFDADGKDEVVINAGIGLPLIYNGKGQLVRYLSPISLGLFTGSPEPIMGKLDGNYAIGDLKGNGRLAIISGGVGLFFGLQELYPGYRIPADHLVNAWYADTGKKIPFWPRITEDLQLTNAHAVADIDGDNLPEVITGSAGHIVHAYNFYGREPEGWPKFTGGWIISTPAVGDINGDGLLEVAVLTREGYLFVWNTAGSADGNLQWSSFAHDSRNTGNYGTTPLSPR